MSNELPIARNRHERRALMSITKKTMNNKAWGEWEHRYDPVRRPPPYIKVSEGLANCWVNNLFSVQEYQSGPWHRIMIRRHDTARVVWAEMQRIKNEIFGEHRIAIEVFPRQSDLVDSANMYWFFLVPQDQEQFIDQVTNNQGRASA